MKEGRQESPDILSLLAYVQLSLSWSSRFWSYSCMELCIGTGKLWEGCQGTGTAPAALGKGSGEDTGKQLSREINITVTHRPEQFWHTYGYCSSICRAVGTPLPLMPPSSSTLRTRTEVDTNTGVSPLAVRPWSQAHTTTTSIPSPPNGSRADPEAALPPCSPGRARFVPPLSPRVCAPGTGCAPPLSARALWHRLWAWDPVSPQPLQH